MAGFAEQASGFHPAENLLDAFAHLLAGLITGMTGGAFVDG